MKQLLLLFSPILLFISCEKPKENSTTQATEYSLVWSDEFNEGTMPDTSKWSYDIEGNKWQWGNQELQAYTKARPNNIKISEGNLIITAEKEEFLDPVSNKKFDYTSTRLISKGKGDWLYGKFVVRAKLPSGRGTWPAIWMLPTDWEYGDWPKSGEIDIMEHVGYEKDSIYASAHTEAYHHSIGTNKTKSIAITDAESNFHEYIVEWGPEEYSVYVDDQKYFTFKNEHKTYKQWPFDKRFHLLLNIAVGGMWGGMKGIDENIWPQSMYIDYVRVYQKQ
ncbi:MULTISPECIES: glycoside hydrolase family 16 protein [Flammeovirga]|uniref:Glycoside hydrolase family 16 protein n=1 Tax=Flammeovirga agarivorans TaxID=2726742 RepID=A0A7X8XUF3_9BACT|nr:MULTISPECIES: glycoside hydrolase family 16 protein [Flammeovirga]NLR90332.1 glycoside hydrolase family 16 protein [Flammeovirga agarivorans]